MVTARMSYTDAIRAYALVRSPLFQIEPLTDADMNRMQDVMEQYADNVFDYVDTAIMALAEQLGVAIVYSFDHLDFRVFRPLIDLICECCHDLLYMCHLRCTVS